MPPPVPPPMVNTNLHTFSWQLNLLLCSVNCSLNTIMAVSRPILAAVCKHETNDPLPLSSDAREQVTRSWNKLHSFNNALLLAGVTVYGRYGLNFTYSSCLDTTLRKKISGKFMLATA